MECIVIVHELILNVQICVQATMQGESTGYGQSNIICSFIVAGILSSREYGSKVELQPIAFVAARQGSHARQLVRLLQAAEYWQLEVTFASLFLDRPKLMLI